MTSFFCALNSSSRSKNSSLSWWYSKTSLRCSSIYFNSVSDIRMAAWHSSTKRVSAPRPCSSSLCSCWNSTSVFCSCCLMSARISATCCSWSLIASTFAFWYCLSLFANCFCLSVLTLASSVSASVLRWAFSCWRFFSSWLLCSTSCFALET